MDPNSVPGTGDLKDGLRDINHPITAVITECTLENLRELRLARTVLL